MNGDEIAAFKYWPRKFDRKTMINKRNINIRGNANFPLLSLLSLLMVVGRHVDRLAR